MLFGIIIPTDAIVAADMDAFSLHSILK